MNHLTLSHSDLNLYFYNKMILELSSAIRNEIGASPDEVFKITKIIGAYELVEITNQYGQTSTINPNEIIDNQ